MQIVIETRRALKFAKIAGRSEFPIRKAIGILREISQQHQIYHSPLFRIQGSRLRFDKNLSLGKKTVAAIFQYIFGLVAAIY